MANIRKKRLSAQINEQMAEQTRRFMYRKNIKNLHQLSDATGVPYQTIRRITNGSRKNSALDNLAADAALFGGVLVARIEDGEEG